MRRTSGTKKFVAPKLQRVKYKPLNVHKLLAEGKSDKLENGWDDRFSIDYTPSHVPRLVPDAVYDSYFDEERQLRLKRRLSPARHLEAPRIQPLFKNGSEAAARGYKTLHEHQQMEHRRQMREQRRSKSSSPRRRLPALRRGRPKRKISSAEQRAKEEKQRVIAEMLESHELEKQKRLARWRKSYQPSSANHKKKKKKPSKQRHRSPPTPAADVQAETDTETAVKTASETVRTTDLTHTDKSQPAEASTTSRATYRNADAEQPLNVCDPNQNFVRDQQLQTLLANATAARDPLREARIVVTVQRVLRGFLARSRVRRRRADDEAENLELLQAASKVETTLAAADLAAAQLDAHPVGGGPNVSGQDHPAIASIDALKEAGTDTAGTATLDDNNSSVSSNDACADNFSVMSDDNTEDLTDSDDDNSTVPDTDGPTKPHRTLPGGFSLAGAVTADHKRDLNVKSGFIRAILAQRVARGFLARRRVQNMIQQGLSSDGDTSNSISTSTNSPDAEAEAAAVMVQSAVRGLLAKRHVQAVTTQQSQADLQMLQEASQSEVFSDQLQQRKSQRAWELLITSQRIVRGFLARKHVRAKAAAGESENLALLQLASKAEQNFAQARWNVFRRHALREARAIVHMQSLVRGHIVRRQNRALADDQGDFDEAEVDEEGADDFF